MSPPPVKNTNLSLTYMAIGVNLLGGTPDVVHKRFKSLFVVRIGTQTAHLGRSKLVLISLVLIGIINTEINCRGDYTKFSTRREERSRE